jgi:uncharacterized coiled-coil DUF342 family protein
MTFQEPDAKTIARMTPTSLKALIAALKDKRDDTVAPLNEQIKYYENLLKTKEQASAKTTS